MPKVLPRGFENEYAALYVFRVALDDEFSIGNAVSVNDFSDDELAPYFARFLEGQDIHEIALDLANGEGGVW